MALREAPAATLGVELRLAYVVGAAGLSGWVAERVAAPTIQGTSVGSCSNSIALLSTRSCAHGPRRG